MAGYWNMGTVYSLYSKRLNSGKLAIVDNSWKTNLYFYLITPIWIVEYLAIVDNLRLTKLSTISRVHSTLFQKNWHYWFIFSKCLDHCWNQAKLLNVKLHTIHGHVLKFWRGMCHKKLLTMIYWKHFTNVIQKPFIYLRSKSLYTIPMVSNLYGSNLQHAHLVQH